MNIWVVVSLILVMLAILGVFIRVPVVSNYSFWFAVGAYIVLAGAVQGRA